MTHAIKHNVRALTALDVIFARRSVRSYTGERLDEVTVRALLDAAVQAPTAMHIEPWAFAVVQDADALKRYSDLAKAIVLATPERPADVGSRNRSRFMDMMADPAFDVFYNAGTLIVICATETGPFAVGDCWLAAENLMLAACAMGLGSCCIGAATEALNTPAVRRELQIPSSAIVVVPIVVGVQRGEVSPVSRKSPRMLRWLRPSR